MFASGKTSAASTGGYQISRSLRFNSADSAYLNRTPASAGNRRTWTWSAWVKRSTLGYKNLFGCGETINVSNNQLFQFAFDASDRLYLFQYNAPTTDLELITTSVYRDVSAWYHLVLTYDTTQATASNRIKVYVNNQQVGFTGSGYPTQNSDGYVNTAIPHLLGRYSGAGPTLYLDAYMTEVNFIDGQALTPSSFGETNAQTGVWQPKAYSGSYGTNGFYLNFSDNSNTTAATLGKDYSGNGNNWTPNNFSVTAGAGNDSLVDSPTSYGTDTGVGGTVRGNYCTLNPLVVFGTSAFSNGNLNVSVSSLNTNNFATIAIPTSGKWYWEYQITAIGGGGSPMAGVATTSSNSPALFYRSNGDKLVDGTSSSYGATYTTTDTIGVAIDTDGGTITFYKNGSSQGAITYATSSGSFFPALRSNAATDNFTVNFGQRAFANTAPSGFKALCTQNLPTPTIGATTATQAGKYFNPVLYTGTGSSQSITGVGFQPDWTWLKNRSAGNNHQLFDAVRGVQKAIYSDLTLAEATNANALTAFGSDGFTLGSESGINGSGSSFVSWNWKANGSGSSNTAGSITSTVSANTTSGFSVVTYTGQSGAGTVGHGLGVAPAMIIVKSRSNGAYGWAVWHSTFTQSEYLLMETTDVKGTASNYWNSSAPSTWTSAFGVGAGPKYVNNSGDTFVAYCFAQIAGYSAFGSYTGNGSTDGAFIYTGFRPAYLMVKRTDASFGWWIFDATRNPSNVVTFYLAADSSGAENNFGVVDFTSNGFKFRDSSQGWNASGGSYIFMAFASVPQKFSLAR